MLRTVTQRPRASLGRVLDDLGDTLLELIHGDPENPAEIDGVVIHDPVASRTIRRTLWCSASRSRPPTWWR